MSGNLKKSRGGFNVNRKCFNCLPSLLLATHIQNPEIRVVNLSSFIFWVTNSPETNENMKISKRQKSSYTSALHEI